MATPAPLPEQHARILADKLYDGQLALFVGAGLSHFCQPADGTDRRLPLWKELAERVAVACHEDIKSYRDVLDLFDAIQYGQERFALEEAVRQALDDEDFQPSEAHNALAVLPWAAILTTNYDGMLARLLGVEPVFDESGYDRLSAARDRQPFLFQIHGSLSHPHTLTREDYREWPAKHPRAYRNLEALVLNKTMLFVGYSLSDPHLDAVLTSVRRMTAGREKRLYCWMWGLDEGQARLLDRRDKIEAIGLGGQEAWAAAFRQVADFHRHRTESNRPVAIPVTADPYAYDRQQYVAAIRGRYGVADLQGLYLWGAGYSRDDVMLAEMFVEPDLELSDPGEANRTPIEGKPVERDVSLRDALAAREASEQGQKGRREGALRVAARENKLLIVGAPGQGKSTLLRRLLIDTATRWVDDPGGTPFPVLVRLSDWETETGPTEGRLNAYARDRIRRLSEIGSGAIEAWLRGQVLWLLDGIDEIRDEHARGRFREEVLAIAGQRTQDRFIVTTRPAGEPPTGMGPGWQRAAMSRLASAQVEQVLAKWSAVLGRKEGLQLDARELAYSLENDAGLREVRTNALLLTLTVLFFKSRGRLPHGRWEFYDAAEQALRDAWARHRLRDAREHLPGDYLPELLERIALGGMEKGRVLFDLGSLQAEAAAVLTTRGYTGRERDQETARFTRAAEDLIGVLVEQGPGRFGFLHLTFQEFFAARALVHRSKDAPAFIERYWDHPDWRETVFLYALGVQSDERRYAELFQSVLGAPHPLDAYIFRPQFVVLQLAGIGTAPLPAAALGTIQWAAQQLEQQSFLAWAALSCFARWERPLPQSIRSFCLAHIKDSGSSFFYYAVQALGTSLKDPAIRDALIAHVGDAGGGFIAGILVRASADETVRAAFFRLLDGDGPGPYIAEEGLRQMAAEPEIREGLLKRLSDSKPATRMIAVGALRPLVGDPEVMGRLLDRLADESPMVRASAVSVLSTVSSEPTINDAVLNCLRAEKDSLFLRDFLEGLAPAAVYPQIRAKLLSFLEHENNWVRKGAAAALYSVVHEHDVRDALMGRLADPDQFVRFDAVRALATLADAEDVRQALLEKARDPYQIIRVEVVRAITPFAADADIRRVIVECAADDGTEEYVRAGAITALSELTADPTIVDKLLALSSDSSSTIKSAAVAALAPVATQPRVKEVVLAAFSDSSLDVQMAAANTLAELIASEKVGPRVAGRPQVT